MKWLSMPSLRQALGCDVPKHVEGVLGGGLVVLVVRHEAAGERDGEQRRARALHEGLKLRSAVGPESAAAGDDDRTLGAVKQIDDAVDLG